MAIKTDLQTVYESLLRQQADPKGLGQEGQNLLKAIESGALGNAEFSTFLQGASYNSADELIGKMRTSLPSVFGTGPQDLANKINETAGTEYSPYDVATELERRTVRDYREDNTGKSFALETGGGLLTGGPAGFARSGLKSMAAAAASGGISGYNASEGDFVEDVSGAGLGAGISLGVQGALNMAKGPFSSLYNAAFKTGNKEATRNGKVLARRKLIETLRDSGLTPEEAVFELADASGKNFNRSMTLGDANDNTRALVDAISVMPGPGKETVNRYLRTRQEGRPSRFGTILEAAFGQKADFYSDFQALKLARNETANKLYGSANAVTVPMTEELTALLATPAMQDAYRRSITIAKNNRQVGLEKFTLLDDGRIVTSDGSPVNGVDTIFLHNIKMGLDDAAFPKMPQTGIGAAEVMSVRDLRTEYLDYLDTANPLYKRARDFYAGDTQTMRTMELGTTFLSHKSPDELAADIVKMNKSEKEAFRLGALQNIQNEIDLSPESANMAYKLMRNQRRKDLLRLTFPDGEKGQASFDVFMGNLNRESGMALTEKAGMNSASIQRNEILSTLKNELAAGNNISQESLSGVLFSSLRDKGAQAADVELKSVASELSRMLTAESPDALRNILIDLEGGGSLVDILRNVRMNNLTPAMMNTLSRPGFVGNQSGNLSGGLDPNFMEGIEMFSNGLTDEQREIVR